MTSHKTVELAPAVIQLTNNAPTFSIQPEKNKTYSKHFAIWEIYLLNETTVTTLMIKNGNTRKELTCFFLSACNCKAH